MWGLDDYQFLPFLWGASQLVGHPHIRPSSILSAEVLEGYSQDYLYLGAVRFVRHVGFPAARSPSLEHAAFLGQAACYYTYGCSHDMACWLSVMEVAFLAAGRGRGAP